MILDIWILSDPVVQSAAHHCGEGVNEGQVVDVAALSGY